MGLQIGEHIIYDSNDNVQYYWKYNNDGLITGDAIEYENMHQVHHVDGKGI